MHHRDFITKKNIKKETKDDIIFCNRTKGLILSTHKFFSKHTNKAF